MSQYDPPGPRPVMDYALQPKRSRGIFGWVLFILLAIMVVALIKGGKRPANNIAVSDFDMLLRSGSVRTVTVSADAVSGDLWSSTTLPNGAAVTGFNVQLPTGMGASFDFMQYLLSNRGRASVHVDNNDNLLLNILVPLIPWVLIFGFIWFLVLRPMRNAQVARSNNVA